MAFQLDSSLNLNTVAVAAASIAAASVVWWRRYRRLARLRVRVAAIHAVSEDILSAASPAEVLSTLGLRLSGILGPCTASLEPAAASGAALALPMRVRGEQVGSLALQGLDASMLQPDERNALAHLANQAAICLRLLDERRLHEQILRGEQLGVAGQLVASIAAELRAPLAHIAALSREHNLEPAAAEALTAIETLDRLISFGRPDLARVQHFDLNESVRGLIEFRSRAWHLEMLAVETALAPGELYVVGARGQVEHALLMLLVSAEQSLAAAGAHSLHVSTALHGERAALTIAFDAPGPDDAAGHAIICGVMETHGGSFRSGRRDGVTSFEVELPLSTGSESPATATRARHGVTRSLTLLVAHHDAAELHALVDALAMRGHRVVVADSAGQTLDRVSRIHFDALLAASKLGDLDWTTLAARAAGHVAAVGLLLGSGEAAPAGVAALHLIPDDEELDTVLARLGAGA
jgi:CheY-like chemotaxis protein